MAELSLTGVLFIADALYCQKDAFVQAAATDAALLVRAKGNQAHPARDPGQVLRRAASLR